MPDTDSNLEVMIMSDVDSSDRVAAGARSRALRTLAQGLLPDVAAATPRWSGGASACLGQTLRGLPPPEPRPTGDQLASVAARHPGVRPFGDASGSGIPRGRPSPSWRAFRARLGGRGR